MKTTICTQIQRIKKEICVNLRYVIKNVWFRFFSHLIGVLEPYYSAAKKQSPNLTFHTNLYIYSYFQGILIGIQNINIKHSYKVENIY